MFTAFHHRRLGNAETKDYVIIMTRNSLRVIVALDLKFS